MAHDDLRPDYSSLDGLLDSLAGCGAELDNTLTNHAPMVVEALCALGRGDAARAWLDAYRPHLLPWPPPRTPIDPDDWRAALGDLTRLTDWDRFFDADLARRSWPEVVKTWVPRLIAGLSGAATHGVIRAGHAVRSLADRDTAPRRRELAAALAYWAASYRELPLANRSAQAGTASWALAQVPLLPPQARHHEGSIDAALAPLADWPEFERVGALLDVDRAPVTVADELLALFARVLIGNAKNFITAIVFTHAVTSLVALLHLLPQLTPDQARRALRLGWQAAAALYSVYGSRLPAESHGVARARLASAAAGADEPSSLVAAAIRSGDEHAIKITEACLFAHRRHPDPAFLAAAAQATQLLSRH